MPVLNPSCSLDNPSPRVSSQFPVSQRRLLAANGRNFEPSRSRLRDWCHDRHKKSQKKKDERVVLRILRDRRGQLFLSVTSRCALLQSTRHSVSMRTSRKTSVSQAIELRLAELSDRIVACRKCPRLVCYRAQVARTKRRAYRDWTYWGRPVPGFGDARAPLMIIGLAPAAHGSNRTGRMFTGDRSGDFLYRQLYRAGFASLPTSSHRGDGLALRNAYISAVVRCAPPDNRPLPSELDNCAGYLHEELDLLKPRAVLALGAIAFAAYLKLLVGRGEIASRAPYRFAHGVEFRLPGALPRLFACYHPSQQNTQTGRLTHAMFSAALRRIRRMLDASQE